MEIPVSFDVHRKIAPFAQNNGTRWWHEDVNTGTSREVRNARRAKNSNGSRDAYPPSCCLVIRRHNGSRPATLLLHQWRKEEKKKDLFWSSSLVCGSSKERPCEQRRSERRFHIPSHSNVFSFSGSDSSILQTRTHILSGCIDGTRRVDVRIGRP